MGAGMGRRREWGGGNGKLAERREWDRRQWGQAGVGPWLKSDTSCRLQAYFLRQISPRVFLRSQTLLACNSAPEPRRARSCSSSSSSSHKHQSGEAPEPRNRTSTSTGGQLLK